jgi:hypothetical protein
MAVSPAKENILKKIRQALSNPVPLPFPHSEGAQTVLKQVRKMQPSCLQKSLPNSREGLHFVQESMTLKFNCSNYW